MLKVHSQVVKGEEPFLHEHFFKSNVGKEWSANEEINTSFPTVEDYEGVVRNSIQSFDRVETYILIGRKVIGMMVSLNYTDMHYGNTVAVGILWVIPDYRGYQEINKLLVKALRDAAIQCGASVYIRSSKVTPYLTKQIARRIK